MSVCLLQRHMNMKAAAATAIFIKYTGKQRGPAATTALIFVLCRPENGQLTLAAPAF